MQLQAGNYRPAIEFWLGRFVIFQGIWTSISKKPHIFVIFQEWGGPDPWPRPSGSTHEVPASHKLAQ